MSLLLSPSAYLLCCSYPVLSWRCRRCTQTRRIQLQSPWIIPPVAVSQHVLAQMYDWLSGPRHINGFMPDEAGLKQLGYSLNEVYKF